MSELDELYAIVDDDSLVPEGAELEEEEVNEFKDKMKKIIKEVYDAEGGE